MTAQYSALPVSDDHLRQHGGVEDDGAPPAIVAIPPFVTAWEGLRGVAVLMTCFCHVQHISTPLGVVTGRGGVAIFFVLSGFLITGILHTQQTSRTRTGEQYHYRHLSRFYADRTVRLYPALIVMLGVTLAIEWSVMRRMHDNFLVHIAASLAYMGNMPFVMYMPNIWGNTWSLAVEEQFYILWSLILPLLLALGARRRRTAIVATLMAISWGLSYASWTDRSPFPYWLTDSTMPFGNFWKMWLGALVRLSPGWVPRWTMRRSGAWCGMAILALLCVWSSVEKPIDLSLLGLSEAYFGWKVWHEPLISIAAVLLILGSIEGNVLLESQGLRFVGRISYPLYLYQVPLIKMRGVIVEGYEGVGLTCFAILLATLSTLYVEEPLRARYREWRKARATTALPTHCT